MLGLWGLSFRPKVCLVKQVLLPMVLFGAVVYLPTRLQAKWVQREMCLFSGGGKREGWPGGSYIKRGSIRRVGSTRDQGICVHTFLEMGSKASEDTGGGKGDFVSIVQESF